jgi:hypothetical protein
MLIVLGWAGKLSVQSLIGRFQLEISNIRVHKVRIRDLSKDIKNKKIFIIDDDQGGYSVSKEEYKKIQAADDGKEDKRKRKKMKTSQSSGSIKEEKEAKPKNPGVFFITKDNLKVAIKGFNLILTADYRITEDVNGEQVDRMVNGHLWVRVTDSVLFLTMKPTHNSVTGEPTLELSTREPTLKFGKVNVRFQGPEFQFMHNLVAKAVVRALREPINNLFQFIVQQEVPTLVNVIWPVVVDNIIRVTTEFLNQFKISPPDFPRLLIKDMRWRVQDYKLRFGWDMSYVPDRDAANLKIAFEVSYDHNYYIDIISLSYNLLKLHCVIYMYTVRHLLIVLGMEARVRTRIIEHETKRKACPSWYHVPLPRHCDEDG